jgi:hypothetical protein
MRSLTILAASVLLSLTAPQSQAGEAEAMAVIDRQMGVLSWQMSCSIVNTDLHGIQRKLWSKQRQDLLRELAGAMAARKTDPNASPFYAEVQAKTDFDALLAPANGSIADLAAFCRKDLGTAGFEQLMDDPAPRALAPAVLEAYAKP